MNEEEAIDPELARRLAQVYHLPREPRSMDDYYALVRAENRENPQMKAYLEKMRRGQVIMGETPADRGYSVSIPEREGVNVMCGYDAVVTAVLREEGRVKGACPHCGEAITIRIKSGRLEDIDPDSIVFWLGTGPPGGPGHPVCDHLHLFPGPEHLGAWLAVRPDELGFEIPLKDLVRQLVEAEAS